ncbi:MAG: DUF6876 family protein [Candidatus Sulfotelmatobacter sp.]
MSTTETKKPLDESELANFTGSENWYRHWLGKALYTDGMKFVAEHAGAFWLIDEIVLNQTRPTVKAEEFQVWVLAVDLEKRKGMLRCEDGNSNTVFTKKIEFTDFPLPEFKVYFTDNTILLPSEY